MTCFVHDPDCAWTDIRDKRLVINYHGTMVERRQHTFSATFWLFDGFFSGGQWFIFDDGAAVQEARNDDRCDVEWYIDLFELFWEGYYDDADDDYKIVSRGRVMILS